MHGDIKETELRVSDLEGDLIDCLKVCGLSKETTVGIMMFLDTEEKQNEMMNFFMGYYEKRRPTEQEILRKLKEIVT